MQNTDNYDIYGYTYNYVSPDSSEKRYITPQVKAFLRAMNKVVRDNDSPTSPDAILAAYFNNVENQKGWNVYSTLQEYNTTFVWEQCSNYINQNYHSANDSTHLYPNFLRTGYQMLIYSGNADAAVPFTYTRYCMQDLFNNFGVNLTESQPWDLWNPLPDHQLGGWVESWKNNDLNEGAPQNYLTFAIVRGAGHEVPMYQPVSSYYMFTQFING